MTPKRMSHVVYETRYHLVRAQKYRKLILEEKIRYAVNGLFQEILAAKDYEIAEDHVHIFRIYHPDILLDK